MASTVGSVTISPDQGQGDTNDRPAVSVVTTLIENPASYYKLVWKKESKKPIYVKNHKIFIGDFEAAYGLWEANDQPGVQYRLKQDRTRNQSQ